MYRKVSVFMKDNQVNSVENFLKAVSFFDPYKNNDTLFFRGQLTKYSTMDPTIARDNGEKLKRENALFEENKNDNRSNFQNLAYMQHQGIATRLLDFTTDPLVALYFAVNNDQREDSSIYIFIRNNVAENSLEAKLMSFIPSVKTRNVKRLVEMFNAKFQEDISISNAKEILQTDLFIDPISLTDRSNYRMMQQKGTFAFPANIIENGSIVGTQPFEDSKSYQEIIIPFEFQEQIFTELKKRDYSAKRLYGDKLYDRKVENLKSFAGVVDEHFYPVTSALRKGKEYVECSKLLKQKEIEKLGLSIAKNRNLECLALWFQRKYAKDGVNIVTQFWSQGRGTGKYYWNTGQKVDRFILNESWESNYVVRRLFYDHPELFKKRKLLPQSSDALEVKMKISDQQDNLCIETNLYEGANLNIIVNKKQYTISTHKNINKYFIKLDRNLKEIKGEVILVTPSLQSKEFLNKTGIDFENLRGSFVKREENMTSLIMGRKSFIFKRD